MSVEYPTMESSDLHHRCPSETAIESVAPEARADASIQNAIPLHVRIERTKLRTRVAALERELAASQQRRQTLIDQYERVLADRTREYDHASRPDGGRSSKILRRLF